MKGKVAGVSLTEGFLTNDKFIFSIKNGNLKVFPSVGKTT